MILKSAIAFRHVSFEDVGCFEPVLKRHGYSLTYYDVGIESVNSLDATAPELVIVLGGPISAYDEAQYPFLREELAFLNSRLAADRPTLGICLGSQLIARVLGARIFSMGIKEIGFSTVRLTPTGMKTCLSSLAVDGIVLHWHGDTFDLPDGATHLAYSDICPNQAFAYGPNILALQFHLETSASNFEHWLIGHACELAAAKISAAELRTAARRYSPVLAREAKAVLGSWLGALGTR